MELQFQNLKKTYGSRPALSGISMTLTEGIYGLLGPNGAGKSTMMNIITGNLKQSSGRILLDGTDIRKLGVNFRGRLGYMPQQQTLYPSFSAEQFLFYIGSLRKMDRRTAARRIDWALQLLSLDDARKKPIRSLSGGMKQRLLLAQSILADPDILILDEPTAGLDPKQRIAVRNLIFKIAMHKIVLISTHVVSDIEYISKELILLSHGKILRQDTAIQLENELTGQVWEASVPEDDLPKLEQYGRVCGVANTAQGVLVRILSKRNRLFRVNRCVRRWKTFICTISGGKTKFALRTEKGSLQPLYPVFVCWGNFAEWHPVLLSLRG